MHNFIARTIVNFSRGSPENYPLLAKYINRILSKTYQNSSLSVVTTALFFFQKISISTRNKQSPLGIYHVFVACLVLADALLNDTAIDISSWSIVSMIKKQDILRMRAEILETLDYRLNISVEEYTDWLIKLDLLFKIDEQFNGSTDYVFPHIASTTMTTKIFHDLNYPLLL